MKRHLRTILCFFLFALFVCASWPVAASADTGPKPSVHVSFENMGEELCYGTLLSKASSTGPYSVWDGSEEHAYRSRSDLSDDMWSEEIWYAFAGYEDADGYHYLEGTIWRVDQTKAYDWTYYPPHSFKILLYYPQTARFVVSGICERYAFDSYYTVDLAQADAVSSGQGTDRPVGVVLQARRSYPWQQETISLVARILITIAIEMGIALLFGFRSKKELLLLIIVNAITQIALNVLLNIIHFRSGQLAFLFGYFGLEFLVFVLEAAIYAVFLKKLSDRARSTGTYLLYALVANVASFFVGLMIAVVLPGIF
ncbi:MAG: hypothetical protein IK095_10200 [Oscillospiraceae bacterium]|nr:hypothetical protein [Oscillospiraceae bacterium]